MFAEHDHGSLQEKHNDSPPSKHLGRNSWTRWFTSLSNFHILLLKLITGSIRTGRTAPRLLQKKTKFGSKGSSKAGTLRTETEESTILLNWTKTATRGWGTWGLRVTPTEESPGRSREEWENSRSGRKHSQRSSRQISERTGARNSQREDSNTYQAKRRKKEGNREEQLQRPPAREQSRRGRRCIHRVLGEETRLRAGRAKEKAGFTRRGWVRWCVWVLYKPFAETDLTLDLLNWADSFKIPTTVRLTGRLLIRS